MPRLFYLLPTEIETPKTCVLFVIVHSVQAMLGAEKNIGLRDRASGERYCKQERVEDARSSISAGDTLLGIGFGSWKT